jgi:alpha-L-fucosidase
MLKGSLKDSNRKWWEKPGFGIQYQIEARPGWIWERDFDKFNASMKDKEGNLNFNGPFCKMKEWVRFSKAVGVDYHMFESKWHDGICYFDTKYTDWKTPIDYCNIFAEESKKLKIPFMFYYSSIFDHNPQFDEIQPVRRITSSYIALRREKKEEVVDFCLKFTQFIINEFVESLKKERRKGNKERVEKAKKDSISLNLNEATDFINLKVTYLKDTPVDFTYNPEIYENYLRNQLIELIERYHPDGMWMDWFMKSIFREESTKLIIDLMHQRYPQIVLAFNNSINEQPDWAYYLSGEAHTVDSAWEQSNKFRRKTQPWELIGPAAKSWFDPFPRSDPFEVARIAVIIMANGGKSCFGLPSQMDGSLYPEPARHIEDFGRWFQKRHDVFTEAIPMDYKGENVPGVSLSDNEYGVVGSSYRNDKIIHLINFLGEKKSISLDFSLADWGTINNVILIPDDIELKPKMNSHAFHLLIPQDFIDPVDTIIRIVGKM